MHLIELHKANGVLIQRFPESGSGITSYVAREPGIYPVIALTPLGRAVRMVPLF
ncbi:MAG TPA: hypothetical protein VJ385_22275 [Fibrobacteria bacterium]|nr:hypothetical protein [Fibrobacteria bacterium]